MMKVCWNKYVFILLALLPMTCMAIAPSWQIVPDESSLTFTAIQNGAPVTGKFKIFTGNINFDPNELKESHVRIVVDVDSISDAYNQLADTLKTPEWLNIKIFPQAVFDSTTFIKTGDKTYHVKGNLTIRDKTLPVTLIIMQEKYTPTQARIKGTTTVKRLAFNVGQGEWANTKTVKDEVQVDFTITAIKK